MTRSAGLLNPNHYLAVAISYLFPTGPAGSDAGVGKTLVLHQHDRPRRKKPGAARWTKYPWGSSGSWTGCWKGRSGSAAKKAPARLLRRDGKPWTPTRTASFFGLLAAEMMARTGLRPRRDLSQSSPNNSARRSTSGSTPRPPRSRRRGWPRLPEQVTATEFAGDPIEAKFNLAPGNGAPLGGLKVVPAAAGSPRVPPAPKTSTRSTPRVSPAKPTCARSRPPPRNWSQRRWAGKSAGWQAGKAGACPTYLRDFRRQKEVGGQALPLKACQKACPIRDPGRDSAYKFLVRR